MSIYSNAMGHLRAPVRRVFFERDGWKCYLCGRLVVAWKAEDGTSLPHNAATLDHVVPIARGGNSSDSNLRTACAECNNRKGALTVEEFARSAPPTTRAAASRGVLTVTLAELLSAKGLGLTPARSAA